MSKSGDGIEKQGIILLCSFMHLCSLFFYETLKQELLVSWWRRIMLSGISSQNENET